jgi:hypothetical protein
MDVTLILDFNILEKIFRRHLNTLLKYKLSFMGGNLNKASQALVISSKQATFVFFWDPLNPKHPAVKFTRILSKLSKIITRMLFLVILTDIFNFSMD